MKVETYLPVFSGFYGTLFELQDADDLEEINCERELKGLDRIDYDNLEFDYESARIHTAKLACQFVHNELNFISGVEFQEVVSPREYNFTNDSINCEIDLDFEALLAYLIENKEEFIEYIRSNYTSYDGFISWHSNDASEWTREYILEDAKHRVGSCLNFVLHNEIEEVEYAMYDYCSSNGGIMVYASNYDELCNGGE